MYFKLTPEQLTKVLNYLASRPWAEVNNLIAELSKLEKITPSPATSESEQSHTQAKEAGK